MHNFTFILSWFWLTPCKIRSKNGHPAIKLKRVMSELFHSFINSYVSFKNLPLYDFSIIQMFLTRISFVYRSGTFDQTFAWQRRPNCFSYEFRRGFCCCENKKSSGPFLLIPPQGYGIIWPRSERGQACTRHLFDCRTKIQRGSWSKRCKKPSLTDTKNRCTHPLLFL